MVVLGTLSVARHRTGRQIFTANEAAKSMPLGVYNFSLQEHFCYGARGTWAVTIQSNSCE
jgi:hypothetical protein